ncbi:heat shock protein beta-1-like [Synchiropus splendidus]|uniref:heat shock protein beta-1-like n=1 Tax=Synchiropus splendidus TaxID=270530 RepID=UPI00237EB017|nr:heat shock protein beta-1-like [Synchiropus splendidus]
MSDQNKILSRPIFRRDANWDPFPNWTQPSRIFVQDFGLPPLLEPGDVKWIDWAQKRLASFSWPGFAQSPLLPPFSGQNHRDEKQGGLSEVRFGPETWEITLDVNHFLPEEITVTTKEGYLHVSGTHQERQNQHGVVSRCFTRKYKLPPGVDSQLISSSLSRDGILSVEAPVGGTDGSKDGSEVVIPIQIRQEENKEKTEESPQDILL